ncbi:hypothetical protein [Patulibacter defluvii]|uniref:hypothetical protein n=1 Tax=Patulibacter defluvii TaxID=3095358 RepID=UPI002A7494A6|nr:hypothetical protein [Patulibacter sp. DM4]
MRIPAAALAAATLALGLPATASADGPYSLSYSAFGATVPPGTTFTASSPSIQIKSTSGALALTCSASMAGVTVGGASATLKATSGSFTGCVGPATPAPVSAGWTGDTPLTIAPYAVNPIGGPYDSAISGVSIAMACGATYNGTLTGPIQWVNDAGGSRIVLSNAGTLVKDSSTACPTLPMNAVVNGSYRLATVNGFAVSATNNLWFKP